ncbi:putative membrane protein [Archaeoglobus sulfaticallidus PM70-1]|uniref:Putative membrane protein n=1 Tax=Archaeoglobus sulfaticallidus PM70-1 TaxID=387631 RepID=N0BEI0_9EURY|nr:DUF599 domain-containing protein [Archaeoglobus sulfaticallidus]AGK60677.1 putative membrane protein [Archaeoglobus sulfaticallidus PM70-1]
MVDSSNFFALIVFLICFAGYHGSYLILSKKYPKKVVKTYTNIFREKGIENVIKKREPLVLVQQLRDAIYVSNLFASASLIFIGMLLNLLINLNTLAESLKITDVGLFEFKILFIAALQAISFIFFVSSLRYYRMVSLLATTPPETIREHLGIEAYKYLAHLLNRGCSFYTLGSRGILYSILLLAWFVNEWLFMAIVVLTTVLFAKYRDFVRDRKECCM